MHEPTAIITIVVILGTVGFSYLGFQNRAFEERFIFEPRFVLANKQYYRIFSSGFLHLDWGHLLFNMFGLYMFGRYIELAMGPLIMLLIYFSSIVGGSLLSLLFHRHHAYRALGASGGVFGILYSFIFLFPGAELALLFLPIPMPSWVFALLYLAYTLWGLKSGKDNIGHDAHLGGALVGLLVTTVVDPRIVAQSPVLYFAIVGLSCGTIYMLLNKTTPSLSRVGEIFSKSDEKPMDHRYSIGHRVKKKEMDRILDKISEEGMGSLTPEERRILERYSKRK